MQTPLEGPFADPTQGAGTGGAELGTRCSLAGIEPRDLPAGEVPLRPTPLTFSHFLNKNKKYNHTLVTEAQ